MTRPLPAAAVALALGASTGCTVGQGEGAVYSDRLLAPDCWDRQYDLNPDFFAAIPYRNTLQIRVQRGSDLQEVSDGLAVLVTDIEQIRSSIAEGGEAEIPVSLPPGVAPPGSPDFVEGDDQGRPSIDPLVHVALYLQQSCHNQNIVLYAVDGTVTFSALFSGDPNEKQAAEKFTDAFFRVTVGDPRDVPLGGDPRTDIPEDRQSVVDGYFRFYFERGQPGQPFP
jgi:hypothetical protein